MTQHDPEVTVDDLTAERVASTEYERAVTTSATLVGPAGPLRIERQYEGLPRHNDELDRDAVDENDELVEAPDAVHVHTRFYAGDGEAYLGDEHDAWRPADPSVLGDDDAFFDACRKHLRGEAADAYARAPTG